jgi:TolB-like protein/tetratricopeptide (TPR) repeat protein
VPRPALPRSRRALIGAGVALALVTGAAIVFGRLRERRPDRNRVAVAVFVNRTGDPSLEPLGNMAADWVTRGLTQTALVDVVDLGALYVEGRSTAGVPTDPHELARRNGAGTVVAGSYYVATDTLVVRATVEDAVSGTVLQTVAPVHAPAADAVRALDVLREHVMAAIAGVFDVRYGSVAARQSAPQSFAAYRAFIDGQAGYWQGRSQAEVKTLFERAAAEDTTFVGSAVWLAFLGANGSGCALTDSVTKALAPRRDRLTPFDRLTLDLSVARCRNDWQSGYRLALEQSRLRPRSTYAVYTAGFFALTSNHIREAHELLGSIDPERDLGWLSDPAKTIYWRDFSAAQHLVGDYEAELREAQRQVRQFPTRLSSRLIAARALAALGRGREALEQIEAMTRLAPDRTARVQTGLPPGLACYLLAAELRVHGDTAASRIAAQQAVDWYREDPARVEGGRFERYQLARSLTILDRPDEALAVLAFGTGPDSTEPLHVGLRGVLAARQGRRAVALAEDARLARIAADPAWAQTAAMQRARIAGALGDREAAFEHFERGVALGVVRVALGHDLHSDPLYDPLRGDPRFERVNRGESAAPSGRDTAEVAGR